MAKALPNPIYLYRISHINNLPYILSSGKLTCPSHTNADKKYVGIGDSTLIQSRGSKTIALGPRGTFLDYVSFYFGPRSPMLYSIANSYNGVTKRSMNEIIYLVSDFGEIKKTKQPYVFFDGHGYHNLSVCYNIETNLVNVPWDIVNAKQWRDTEADPDRKRRKQAEFLVHKELPLSAIKAIVTYDANSLATVNTHLGSNPMKIVVKTITDWYY